VATDVPKDSQDLDLRSASLSDADLLLSWFIQPDSLANSLRSKKEVEPAQHLAWLESRLASPDAEIWIAIQAGERIGQARVERTDAGLEVSIYVDKAARGRGTASSILRSVRTQTMTRWPNLPLIARIKPDNEASKLLFTKAGYQLRSKVIDHEIWQFHRPAEAEFRSDEC